MSSCLLEKWAHDSLSSWFRITPLNIFINRVWYFLEGPVEDSISSKGGTVLLGQQGTVSGGAILCAGNLNMNIRIWIISSWHSPECHLDLDCDRGVTPRIRRGFFHPTADHCEMRGSAGYLGTEPMWEQSPYWESDQPRSIVTWALVMSPSSLCLRNADSHWLLCFNTLRPFSWVI